MLEQLQSLANNYPCFLWNETVPFPINPSRKTIPERISTLADPRAPDSPAEDRRRGGHNGVLLNQDRGGPPAIPRRSVTRPFDALVNRFTAS